MITPYYHNSNTIVYYGDNLEIMPGLEPDSIDTIITDPPYALQFMGKVWDKILPAKETWIECLRVAKPGAIMLVFGGDRTHHRLMVDIEDAGWEIRTCIYWLFGSGFPKSANISKMLDKMQGAEREEGNLKFKGGTQLGIINDDNWQPKDVYESIATTPEAQLWTGWGTALKPAVEIIVLAMAPLDGTFAENALKWGVGGLNINGGRIGFQDKSDEYHRNNVTGGNKFGGKKREYTYRHSNSEGRWPANLILSHLVECSQVGMKKVKSSDRSGYEGKKTTGHIFNKTPPMHSSVRHGDFNGMEEVAIWECAEGCPVKMLDEQSGELISHGGGNLHLEAFLATKNLRLKHLQVKAVLPASSIVPKPQKPNVARTINIPQLNPSSSWNISASLL